MIISGMTFEWEIMSCMLSNDVFSDETFHVIIGCGGGCFAPFVVVGVGGRVRGWGMCIFGKGFKYS
jgi:hypothetical protein